MNNCSSKSIPVNVLFSGKVRIGAHKENYVIGYMRIHTGMTTSSIALIFDRDRGNMGVVRGHQDCTINEVFDLYVGASVSVFVMCD